MSVAEDRSNNPNFRGRGRGGFAQRNFAAAGLTHRKSSGGNVEKKIESGGGGDAPASSKPE